MKLLEKEGQKINIYRGPEDHLVRYFAGLRNTFSPAMIEGNWR